MIYLVIFIVFFIIIFYKIYDPFVDMFEDYRGEKHIILWYNYKGKRKSINIIGSQC